jgi:hypothetical protein
MSLGDHNDTVGERKYTTDTRLPENRLTAVTSRHRILNDVQDYLQTSPISSDACCIESADKLVTYLLQHGIQCHCVVGLFLTDHPFTRYGTPSGNPCSAVHAWVEADTPEGRLIIDLTSSQFAPYLKHSTPRLVCELKQHLPEYSQLPPDFDFRRWLG